MKRGGNNRGEASLSDALGAQRGQFVRIAGEPAGFEIERERDPRRIDHLWILVRAGRFGLLRITINTSSLRNRDLGFDARIRLAVLESRWNELPVAGVVVSEPVDYATIAGHDSPFPGYERVALEALIGEKVARAVFIEAWGELYLRGHSGIHQVHSRRASHAFTTNYVGRDGAVRLYFEEGRAEMLLFKFYGQP